MSHRCDCLGCDRGERLASTELRFFTTRLASDLIDNQPRCARCEEITPCCACTDDELRGWLARVEQTRMPRPDTFSSYGIIGVRPI